MVDKKAPLRDIKLLIVENDEKLAWLERNILTSFGFREIKIVTSGEEAVGILREEPFDIILVDWEMRPMKGIDFVNFIRYDPMTPNPCIPIIMVTGRSEQEDVKEARDAGITEFVAKPFTVSDLRKRIIEVIEYPRRFVMSEKFIGPDRRRHKGEAPDGAERRKEEMGKRKHTWGGGDG